MGEGDYGVVGKSVVESDKQNDLALGKNTFIVLLCG